MQWLAAYLTVVPIPLRKLKKVYGYRTAKGRRTQSLGACNKENGVFTIGLNVGIAGEDQAIGTILQTFAHELAHMVHWDHTPEHAALEAAIYKRFAKRARTLGVKDFSRPRREKKAGR